LELLEERTLLSTLVVDRLTDTGDGSGLAGDLRYCITHAVSGSDTINFGVAGTINLSKALPVLASNVTINGPGADLATVRRDTGGFYRVFTVAPGATVAISGLTIANGFAPLGLGLGGGVYNDGTLAVSNCTLSGNSASDGGAGIYNSSSGTLVITSSVLSGNSGANDGGAVSNGGTLTISNSTLSGNKVTDNGGGIINLSGTLTITGCTLSGNSASDAFGSAICIFGGSLTLSNSTVSANKTTSGAGAIYIRSATAMLTNNAISSNSCGSGGSIVNGGTLTVSSSTISGNTGSGIQTAGGVFNSGTLSISSSTISGNTATGPLAAGGISNIGKLTVSSSTISGNTANGIQTPPTGAAGGIASSGTLTVTNSTISGNTGSGPQTAGGVVNWAGNSDATVMLLDSTIAVNTTSGGDRIASQLYAGHIGMGTGKATTELHNTIISGDGMSHNFFADTAGTFISDGHNLSSDDAGGSLPGSGDQVNANPLLGLLQDNGGPTLTLSLLPGSPAIGTGDTANSPPTDQRGFARSVNGAVDVGAFQSRGFTITALSGDKQQTLVNTPFPSALGVSVSSPFGEPVQGGLILFSAPNSGASATFPAGSSMTVDANGQASVTAAANSSAGSYAVAVSAGGASPVQFSLTNLPKITLSPGSLPHGSAGVDYSQTFTAGGSDPGSFSFAISAGALPAGFMLSNSGVLSGSTTVATTSSFTVTATAAGGFSTSMPYALTIDPAAVAAFTVTGFPSPVTAGVAGTVFVAATDAFGNVATSYAGTIALSSTDPLAALPGNASLTAGTGTLSATFTTAGTQSLTVSDTADPTVTGSQSGIVVSPAAATHLLITGPSTVTAGTAFSITVQAADAFGNLAAGYQGTVTFSSTDNDPGVVLPPDYTFMASDNGVHVFTDGVILRTAGSLALTATDTMDSSIHGSTSNVVSPPVFLVTTTLDGGPGSFRQAVLDADAMAGPVIIRFAIDMGIQTINLESPLPAITEPVMIDGTSQPGYAGAPLIELNGAGAGPDADGLLITVGGSVVRGLVINRFSLNGIELQNGGGNILEGNYIGTDATGVLPLGNGIGVLISSSNNTIGGSAAGTGNVIAGNLGDGIFISDSTANVLQGNKIGTDPSGTINLGNAGTGVHLLNASGNTIGGTPEGASNVIAYNSNDGVLVDSGSANGIQRNTIYSHAKGLGIQLVNGGNNQLAFPVLASATSDGSTVTIAGLLMSTPDTAFTLEFFVNSVSNPSGFGEGQQFLGTATFMTNGRGTAIFTMTFTVALAPGQFIAATATDPNHNTSAFSNCVSVAGPEAPFVKDEGSGRRHGLSAFVPPPASPICPSGPRAPERRVIDLLFGKRNQADIFCKSKIADRRLGEW
jgi:hypothetical protein